MILDNGEQVFLWLGARCSEVEIKLAYKSAQVIIIFYELFVYNSHNNKITHKFLFCVLGLYSAFTSEAAG